MTRIREEKKTIGELTRNKRYPKKNVSITKFQADEITTFLIPTEIQ